MANYDKFRLLWRNNPQKQYDSLQQMVSHLSVISSGITDINVKLNTLPQVITAINNQSLLLQAIADNTACACNGISQVNDNLVSMHEDMNTKLDKVIELLGQNPPVPVPVFVFELSVTSVDITPEIIAAGSFVLTGISTKDGLPFDQLSLVDEYDFIDSVNVISDTQIEVQLTPGAEIPEGTLTIQIRQAVSYIVQQFNIYYTAPVPVVNYIELINGTIVPLFTPLDIQAISSDKASSTSVTVNSFTFYKNQVKSVVIIDGTMFSVPNVTPVSFCRNFSLLESVVLPNDLHAVGDYFLAGCLAFNQPLTLPGRVTAIGRGFLEGDVNFNSPLVLPEGLVSIGNDFLGTCRSFTKSLKLPSTLTSVGDGFMVNCWSFTGILDIGSLLPSVFYDGVFVLSADSAIRDMYTIGISVIGNNANAFRTRFPNFAPSSVYSRYRKLLPYGIIPTPNKLDFAAAGGSQTVKLTSTLPWRYRNYTDSQGITHEGVFPDWLQVEPQSGLHGTFSLSFTVKANVSPVSRYASLIFTTDETSSNIIINQAASNESQVIFTRIGTNTDSIAVGLFKANMLPNQPLTTYSTFLLDVGDSYPFGWDKTIGLPIQNDHGNPFKALDGDVVYVYSIKADGSGAWSYAGYFTLDAKNGNVFEVAHN